MLKRAFFVLICALLLCSCMTAQAYDYGISAFAAVTMDADTRTVFYEKNAYAPMEMASTTKIMTCLLACESGRLDEEVTVSGEMLADAQGTLLYLKEGDRLTLSDLVKGALLASGNDCADAIAVYLDGSVDAFVRRMNERAKELQLGNTVFETPSGLDKGAHHSCAYDMAVLAACAMQNETFRAVVSQQSAAITVSGRQQTVVNHNKLLQKSKHYIGVKTGYTEKAGRCLVSAYDVGGSTVITVTLNAPEDWKDHAFLVKDAKRRYHKENKTRQLTLQTVGSRQNTVSCAYHYNVRSLNEISVRLYYYPIVYAPVGKGEALGRAEIYSGDKLLCTAQITAQEDISYGE